MTPNTSHTIIERDAAFVECYLQYDTDVESLTYEKTEVGDSISGFDTELQCTCGESFESREAATEHVERK